jgi:hypothetical protein
MITIQKLKIYSRYKGDVDMFQRIGKKSERQLMDPDDWLLIDGLLQDLQISESGRGSIGFASNFNKHLRGVCENEECVNNFRTFDKSSGT